MSPQSPYNDLPPLPPQAQLETKAVVRQMVAAHRALAELKGWNFTQANPLLLLQTLTLREAKSSSEIENIVTTNDEIYQALADSPERAVSPQVKEVLHYKEALWHGYQWILRQVPLTINRYIELFRIVKQRSDGVCTLPGTVLKNSRDEVIYTPPDNREDIFRLLTNLEQYINIDTEEDPDPLIKLALIHYQFECIHPFPDGNGRVGRLICVLYLLQQELLTYPVLYLSRYIIHHKQEYYRRLRNVTEQGDWVPWILYMLEAVEDTAKDSLQTIKAIYNSQLALIDKLKREAPDLANKELVELLYEQPYTKISFLVERGLAKSQTASKYLKQLTELGVLDLERRGRENYYINRNLWDILVRI